MAGLVVASSLIAVVDAALRAHPAVARVVACPGHPWEVPGDAGALFTYMSQWTGAPVVPPPGWPFGLRWIQVASVGVDTLPPWVHAVPLVTRAQDLQSTAIAEYAIAAVMAHEKQFFAGTVTGPEDWQPRPIGDVAGRSLGVAGLGAIGREVARLGRAVGMDVTAFARQAGTDTGLVTSLPELFARSDHVVLALPLTPATRGIVEARCLAAARPGLHLVNVARGALVDDEALLAALEEGRIAAATLDVTDPEPLPAGHRFYGHPRIRLTPHCAASTPGGRERLIACLLANLDAYAQGRTPAGVVEPGRGY